MPADGSRFAEWNYLKLVKNRDLYRKKETYVSDP